jgi:hypothetical protein
MQFPEKDTEKISFPGKNAAFVNYQGRQGVFGSTDIARL